MSEIVQYDEWHYSEGAGHMVGGWTDKPDWKRTGRMRWHLHHDRSFGDIVAVEIETPEGLRWFDADKVRVVVEHQGGRSA